MLIQPENCLQGLKWKPYKVRELFSTLVCVNKTNGQPSANQDLSTAKLSSHHVDVTQMVTENTPPHIPPSLLA